MCFLTGELNFAKFVHGDSEVININYASLI